ncbi:hypothetical protein PMAYCL1PPCAC_18467 [Pristionchus mayeri]|uniref:C2H2-type domain-containing protein n=1 Tax=Pristionchus mayeri TaxID=1317129 RepID=A0AAN5CPN5_9BILA|nr:hypothetical protein PMAYCL1PPCAC_18467 [Pristionchus mayeri]
MQKAHLVTHMGRKHREERVEDIDEEMERVRGRDDEVVHGPAPDPSLSSRGNSSNSPPLRPLHDQLHIPIIICAFCGANFSTNNQLKRHRESNHVLRRCLRCGESVNGRLAMKEHERNKHTPPSSLPSSSSPFTCIHCSIHFNQRTQLDRHFLSRHFLISRCEYCREELRTPIERRDHARDEHEEIRCGYCNERMESEEALTKHVKTGHWRRTERKENKKKMRKSKEVKIEEEEEKEESEEEEKEEEEEEEGKEMSISLLLLLPLKKEADHGGRGEESSTLSLGENLPSEIVSFFPQLRSLRVILPSSLSSSHSLLISLPLPFDDSIAEWNQRTIEVDLRNTVDEASIDN